MKRRTPKMNVLFNFDMLATFFAKHATSSKRIASSDLQIHSGLTRRAAQRYYMKLLTELGYLSADDAVPRGYLLSDKAKKIFSPEQYRSPWGCVHGRYQDMCRENFEKQYLQTPSFDSGDEE